MNRLIGAAAFAAGVLAFTTSFVLVFARTAATDDVQLTPTEQSFLSAINAARDAHGLEPLTSDRDLVRAARSHSDDMIARNYFAHGVFWKRLQQFGIDAVHEGENIGWIAPPVNAVGTLVHDWLQSPEHRANLLSPKYSEIGVGVAVGPYQGYPRALVVTTDFLGN